MNRERLAIRARDALAEEGSLAQSVANRYVSALVVRGSPRMSGNPSFVSMMEAPYLWEGDYRTVGGRLYGSWRWRILRQRQMSPGAVIVGQVSGEGGCAGDAFRSG